MNLPDHLVIASRGSRLARRQAEIVSDLLRAVHPQLTIEIKTVTTRGDVDQRPFEQIPGKGLFTSEVERAVAEGEADVAVHSAKDLTSELVDRCHIICVPTRASVHDVIVGGKGETGIDRLGNLSSGARVGTSSMRRRSLLAQARPDVEAVELRGNIDTRLKKVALGEVDAAIMAAAGVERLGLADVGAVASLDPEGWIPAPGQGALAIEALKVRDDLVELFAPIQDDAAAAELACERAFSLTLEGGCSVPLGCLARADGNRIVASGYLSWPDGAQAFRDRISGGIHEAAALGAELAEAILACGGRDVIEDLKEVEPPVVAEP